MAVQRLLDFLNQTHTFYSTVKHDPAYTARSSAKSAHIPSKEMVKSVLLLLDGSYILAVLTSSAKIDFKKVKQVTGSHIASLADEDDIESLFPDCTTGAIPPFGNLYHLPVISDVDVQRHKNIFFEAGTHREIMKMFMSDYLKLAHPKIAAIHR
ncbi:MAG: YbaK/EbsC family protein [Spirochaetaceae bacterium]|jgi:Ala-tRNA(Pro) deacylase|nr:YbaK/EbsC family protein [Spirochaetaceae bacterium]